VDRRLADKNLIEARRRRSDRYQDHGLVELFQLLAQAQDRMAAIRESAGNDAGAIRALVADLDSVRNEIEARGICPYHQAALSVCCYP
jgi:hypothetical protein